MRANTNIVQTPKELAQPKLRPCPLVSIVVPIFNRAETAVRAIRTVQAQRGIAAEDLEIVAVDDGSVPNFEWTDEDTRIRIVRSNHNRGSAAARNVGIHAANGTYIAFLDSDDVWLEEKLQHQLAALRSLEQNSDDRLQGIVCGFYYPNRLTGALQARVPRSAHSLSDFVSGCWFAPGSALMIRRSAFDRVGLLDERLRRLEDLDWFIRFGRLGGKLYVVPYLGVIIAPSYSENAASVAAAIEIIASKFSPIKVPAMSPKIRRRFKAYLSLEQGAAYLLEGERLKGLSYLAASFWHKPRLTPAVESFWERSDDVPKGVLATYHNMIKRA